MDTTTAIRKGWTIDSLVDVFVVSRSKWYPAKVVDVDGKILTVSIQGKILFELDRFDEHLRRHLTKEEIKKERDEKDRIQREKQQKEEQERETFQRNRIQTIISTKTEFIKVTNMNDENFKDEEPDSDLSTDYYTTSDDESTSISSSLSLALSDEEEQELYADEKDEDPALIVIVVERAGTKCVNGTYKYKGDQRGKPLYQKEDDEKAKLYWKYDNLWCLEYGSNDIYIALSQRLLPPSSGWDRIDDSLYPAPSVVLHRLNQLQTIRNYLDPNQNKETAENELDSSPLEMIEYDYEISDNFEEQSIENLLGFKLGLDEVTNKLLIVTHVSDNSQSKEFGLSVGDILSSVEDEDIAAKMTVDDAYAYLKKTMKILKDSKHQFLSMAFGRRKSTFPIVVLSRSGVESLNGKYSIKGKALNAWNFVHNDDEKTQICRIYYDSDEDEAVWVVRKEKDKNEALTIADDEEDKKEKEVEVESKEPEIVDDKWLFPLFKEAQLSDFCGSDNHQCEKKAFVKHYVEKKVKKEIIERIYGVIDKKKRGFIKLNEWFSFKNEFSMQMMRELLPEFCPIPDKVIMSQKQKQERKKAAEKKKKEKEKEKPKVQNKKDALDLNQIETMEQLKKLGFKDLKNLCKLKKLPTNGTKAQLFMKLKENMFSKSKETKEEIAPKVIVSNKEKEKAKVIATTEDLSDSEVSTSSSSSSYEGGHAEKTDKKFFDYYCAMTGYKEQCPPNFGWDTIDPFGVWPAPGLTVHDIELSKQNLQSPVIDKVDVHPFGARVHFSCNEPIIPKICKNMDYYFEVLIVGDENETIVKCQESPAVFGNLINGKEYAFIVKLVSDISIRFSKQSEVIVPLLLPNKPYFTNIETKPKEIYLFWDCIGYDKSDVKAQITLICEPKIQVPDGYECNEYGDIILQSNVIHFKKGVLTGKEYKFQLRASNSVGFMESDIENVSATYPPPAPSIRQVIAGNREIVIDVKCDGYNTKETKCWFEVDLNPTAPMLDWLQNEIYAIKDKKNANKATKNKASMLPASSEHLRQSSMAMRRLQSVRATISTLFTNIDLASALSVEQSVDDEKMPGFGNDDDDFFVDIPQYKREKRYTSLPIIISPLLNGEEYIVTVRARNYTSIKSSKPSNFVTPSGLPPQPIINSVQPRDGEVKLSFACDDYSTLEYRVNTFEIVSMPKSSKTKTRRHNMKVRNLNNGTPYSFKVRGINSVGKGPWSDFSSFIKPLKSPAKIHEIRCVPGSTEVSLYWISDDVNKEEYNGWFEITAKPSCGYTVITKRQQCTMKNLINSQSYKFRIYACNIVGRSNKHETDSVKPRHNVKKKLYESLKEKTVSNMNELRQSYLEKIENKKTKKKKTKGINANAKAYFEKEIDKTKSKTSKAKKSKKKDKKKKKKKKKKTDLSDFASMIEQQKSVEEKSKMKQAKSALFARTRKASVMSVNRVDKFSLKFNNIPSRQRS